MGEGSERALSLLGLAQAAGKVASGEDAARIALQRGRGALIVIAADAAPTTQKRFRLLGERMEVPLRIGGTRESLGRAIGKEWRAVVVVQDAQFARAIREAFDGEEK